MYQVMQQRMAHFSRPGSAYVINMDTVGANSQGNKVQLLIDIADNIVDSEFYYDSNFDC